MTTIPRTMSTCAGSTAGAEVPYHTATSMARSSTGQATLLSLDDADPVYRAVGTHGHAADPEAFGALYERYLPVILAFALSKLHDRAQAEDITAQTFLQAFQALPRYQQRGVPIRHWFFQITVNLIAGLHRAAPALLVQIGERTDDTQDGLARAALLDLPDPHAAGAIAAWEAAEDVQRLLASLSPGQRTVLWLRFGECLATTAIAARTGR